ncbi:MAG: nucleoside triphosphate pyrophosphohydrolase [Prevotellaceae bacterium]|jgi:XTP/dITP diphosphohydrolase|nr:nucleoside triphosphate pyrophosphohydrolase [Prevotellaceae bacterium]
MNETLQSFERLLNIMSELREKCPWDREQTIGSIRPLTIEETYELSEAILAGDMQNIRKELGDILLHIVFYAKIASEANAFGIKDVIDGLCDKLIYRHPHVFGERRADTAGQVIKNWEQLKLKEKDGNKTVLSGVPSSLPTLIKARRIQEKASAVGFDWEQREQVWGKVREELHELQVEVEKADAHKMEEEFGDLLFAMVNAARLYGIDSETALERANKKFIRRFGYLEQQTIKQGRPLTEMTLEEMNKIWEEAKSNENSIS